MIRELEGRVWESSLTPVSVDDKFGVNLSGLIWWSYVDPLPALPHTNTLAHQYRHTAAVKNACMQTIYILACIVQYSLTCVLWHAFTPPCEILTHDVHLILSE